MKSTVVLYQSQRAGKEFFVGKKNPNHAKSSYTGLEHFISFHETERDAWKEAYRRQKNLVEREYEKLRSYRKLARTK